MKKITNLLMAAFVLSASMSLASCSKDEKKDDPTSTPTESATYAFNYMNRTLEPGQTVYFHPTAEQMANDWAIVEFMLENKSSEEQMTYMKVERIGGPSSFDNLTICFGESCKIGTCPWTSDEFVLVPGVNSEMPISVEYSPSTAASENGLYRITIGKGSNLADPQVMMLDMAAN